MQSKTKQNYLESEESNDARQSKNKVKEPGMIKRAKKAKEQSKSKAKKQSKSKSKEAKQQGTI